MKSTIKDIARKVGVNPSTVSRVINGTASISNETKEKIYEAMREMDYHPNSQARRLVNGSTFTIGLVIDAGNSDAYSNAFFISSVSAIERVTQDRGYNLLITNSGNCQNQNAVENLILENKVDGVILPVSDVTDELIELLVSKEFPFVIMGEPEKELNQDYWVDMNNEQGGRLAVQHLIQSGYHCPMLFVEDKATVFEKNRIQGFQKQLELSGIECGESNIVECGTDAEQIIAKVNMVLHDFTKVDSIICTNNIVAFHVIQELKKGGKRIPEDMGIVAFDNYPLAEYMEPPLTVVDVNTYKLGELAANILFDKMKQIRKDDKKSLIDTQMIVRKSTRGRKEERQ
ncbi:MAG: LacI family transcriptional regulator [Lachnospiraceae bacterium]|nr:LacI family transcriptional regulator [Lachnospiraceae bacterium]